jgi:hypothetical protein
MNYYSFNNKLNWSIHMYSRQFTQYIFGLVFLVSSSFALSNTEFTWYWYDESQVTLTGCVGQCPTNLAIPEEINTFSVRAIGEWAFNSSQLQNVIIPNSVEVIVSEGFSDNQLTNITIPDSVVSIGGGAFANNQLNSVLFKGSRPAMYLPFINNPNLQSIYYCPETEGWPGDPINQITPQLDEGCGTPNEPFTYSFIEGGVEVTGCFGECPADLVIPSEIDGFDVLKIGDFSFDEKQLNSILLPDTLITIGNNAFQSNSLSSLIIPPNVISIGDSAFHSNSLTSLTIPSNVQSVGSAAFVYNQISSLEISDSIERIEGFAFAYNLLQQVSIPESVTYIGGYAFDRNFLSSLIMPKNITYIGEKAFRGSSLVTISFLGDRPDILHNFPFLDNDIEDIYYCNETSGWPGMPIEGITPQLDESCGIPNEANETISYAALDIDQNGSFDALTDGLILLRYAFGLTGDNLIDGVIDSNANRTNAADIEAHIQSLVP